MNTSEATMDTMGQVDELARGMGEAAAAVDPGFRYTVRAGDLAKVCGAFGRVRDQLALANVVKDASLETLAEQHRALSANVRMCELLLGKALNGDDAPHPEPGTLQQLTRGVIDGLQFAMNEGKAILKDAEGVLWALKQVHEHPSFGWLVREIATPIAMHSAGMRKDDSPDAPQNVEALRLLLAVLLGGQVEVGR